MSYLRTPLSSHVLILRRGANIHFAPIRAFSVSSPIKAKQAPAPPNQPPSGKSVGRKTSPSEDTQSSASSKEPEELNTGDDHPAKQPDPQLEGDRSTGCNKVPGGVAGGKAGQGQMSDKGSQCRHWTRDWESHFISGVVM
ncbi:hypothetical protein BDV97DRAFT_360014 [Delphinella strobiligena]|nr:hypothetical protein BDV97DRAFT_360014 [Delphinella strobiligena]